MDPLGVSRKTTTFLGIKKQDLGESGEQMAFFWGEVRGMHENKEAFEGRTLE